ncbi:1H-3-hydroxy-4-oxoquinaldine 2,4-dioxygenase [Aspergillus cavernicola]|uniref:1H-3-hydroxy-4-oxoquinaldine 2,4-dioxygenase n=1 Tax=Aspergillus cavernicola TaxID=176166 RepID=A0ABR4I8E9_9EURO
MLLTKTINGVEICYDECGNADGPALVLLSGWAHDLRLYDPLLPHLTPNHWVIRLCWRGHGPSRDEIDDFGVEEQINDTLALLDSLEVEQFYLVSHSHGGWPALGIVDRLGASRVLGLLMIDQIMTPPPAGFAAGLQAMQEKATWKAARQDLFNDWLAHSNNNAVRDHFLYSFGSYGRKMWALSCRVIADAYGEYESPMGRMEMLRDPCPIRHVFSHPLNKPEYRELHEEFSRKHGWFSYSDLKGETHFPSLEIPERVAEEIEDLVRVTVF